MPTADAALAAPPAPSVRYVVRHSMAMELVWALLVVPGEPEVEYPARAGRFDSVPGLQERVRGFWGDGVDCYTEIVVVADRGGVLFEEDPNRLWGGLAAGAAATPRFEPLESETPEEQEVFRARLARLREDPVTREGWLAVLRDVWDAIAGAWEETGRSAVDTYAWELEGKLGGTGGYAELEPFAKCDFNGLLPRMVRQFSAQGHEVTVTPGWLARRGYVVALADRLVVAPAAPEIPPGPSPETRERARRLKALGDPTRLAILEACARRPRAVGALAGDMGLAQPTVSNHVRILRDAGLLIQGKESGRRLQPDFAAFERLLEEARGAVVRPRSGSY
ncbi:MAG: ArsR/SmtB family transcription factor [Acidimicrobiales bacterium]